MSDAVLDPGGDEDYLCQRLQAVVATIVLAQTPMDVEALATFSGISPQDITIVVGQLSSLLTHSNAAVRVFHPSFTDFAIDSNRCTDRGLRVAPTADHGTIALRCLALMNQSLRYDICNIRDPAIANLDVQDLDKMLTEHVSDALRYAISFWCTHLSASGPPDVTLLSALEAFCRRHLFHWVEVLSLLKSAFLGETEVVKAIEWCNVCVLLLDAVQMNLT
jgi:hypothetical protein